MRGADLAPHERICDRYGTVFLMSGGDSQHEPGGYVPVPDDAPVGLPGRLVAEVQATRQRPTSVTCSVACGQTPQVGERILLGEGRLFCQMVDRQEGIEAVGCAPDDDRDHDWLDPRALYRAHEQTVRLIFEDDPDA